MGYMGRKATKSSNESMLTKCIKSPYRILLKARDIYVKSMSDCAGNSAFGGAMMGYPTPCALPKSYSTTSSRMSDITDEDFKELIRAASQRGNSLKSTTKINIAEFQPTKTMKSSSNCDNPPLPRSFTVGIGRIDEDKALDFDDNIKVKTDSFYPRSRSYAVTSKRNTAFIS